MVGRAACVIIHSNRGQQIEREFIISLPLGFSIKIAYRSSFLNIKQSFNLDQELIWSGTVQFNTTETIMERIKN